HRMFRLAICLLSYLFFFSSRRRHTRFKCDWSSDVCSSDLHVPTSGCMSSGSRCSRMLARASDTALAASPSTHSAHIACSRAWLRSEERRVGKECPSQWAAERAKKEDGVRSGRQSECLASEI